MTKPDVDGTGAVGAGTDEAWDMVGMPMPRDLALLDPSTRRLRVRTVTDRFPFPIPNGW